MDIKLVGTTRTRRETHMFPCFLGTWFRESLWPSSHDWISRDFGFPRPLVGKNLARDFNVSSAPSSGRSLELILLMSGLLEISSQNIITSLSSSHLWEVTVPEHSENLKELQKHLTSHGSILFTWWIFVMSNFMATEPQYKLQSRIRASIARCNRIEIRLLEKKVLLKTYG